MRLANLTESRILVVDDQEANLTALTVVLGVSGYQNVKCLNDSRQVLSVFADFAPDLILLDLHMPHIDGLEVLDQLGKVISEDDYLPVLVLTGDGTSGAKEKALSRGAHDFLSKPLNRTEVQLRVNNLLQTRQLHLQLKAQNAFLEKQVRERTALAEELALTNRQVEETNRKLKETQTHLVHSEKMASLGQLVAGIAHEINNPLAFVINNIFIVQEGLERLGNEQGLSPEMLGRLGKIQVQIKEAREGARRVKELVSNLRTFSRLDEGTFKTINVQESIESVLLFLRHKTDGRIQVERNYGNVETLSCLAGELNQVLMNVIANAIDSIPGDGKITLTTAQEDGNFVIRVRDTGNGIPEAIRHRIFEPFFTTKPIGQGTGLGLAISYGIVQAHHGSMEFSSKDGEGTEFVVKIPSSLPHAEAGTIHAETLG